MTVVDQHCRLRTIPNLRVVDASVMPSIPRANINLTWQFRWNARPVQ
jgi:choline dehydrogenase-like flavoprotein